MTSVFTEPQMALKRISATSNLASKAMSTNHSQDNSTKKAQAKMVLERKFLTEETQLILSQLKGSLKVTN